MKSFQVRSQTRLSSIYVGESLENLNNYLPTGHSIIITDENVKALYANQFPDLPVITIGMGEKIKTMATVENILKQLLDYDCDRSSFIVGIGGGIVTDVTGFVASVFMRGVKFGFVSTSLLSQVDASVGGKNGVNLDAFKNMVGVFNQPEFVICDIDLLNTLPKDEISNGLAEIVKHALISDPEMFDFLEQNRKKALDLDYDTIFRLVADSVRIKSEVVQKDERETGERRKLNFGHTIGHAIEKIEGPGHGKAVSMGMVAAGLFSHQKKLIPKETLDRIERLLTGLNLPTHLNYPAQKIIDAVGKDKKKQRDHIYYVFLDHIGSARVEKISMDEMNQFIHNHFNLDSASVNKA